MSRYAWAAFGIVPRVPLHEIPRGKSSVLRFVSPWSPIQSLLLVSGAGFRPDALRYRLPVGWALAHRVAYHAAHHVARHLARHLDHHAAHHVAHHMAHHMAYRAAHHVAHPDSRLCALHYRLALGFPRCALRYP